MLSHEKKFIFIHIGKNGGSAIEKYLAPWSNDKILIEDGVLGKNQEVTVVPGTDIPGNDDNYKHWYAYHYQRRFPKEYSEYLKFAVIRNPWDRAVSYFLYFSGSPNVFRDPTKKETHKTFERFLSGQPYYSPELDYMKDPIDITNQLQSFYLINNTGQIDQDIVLLRFSKLSKSMKKICKILNIPIESTNDGTDFLPTINQTRNSQKAHYSEYYNDKTKALVDEKWDKDIVNFGYTFDNKVVNK